jgi:predicted nucleic acid-binding protein
LILGGAERGDVSKQDLTLALLQRLADGLEAWRSRFAGRIFAFTEEAALSYGELMGEAARAGRPMSAPDGMIAAIARVHSAPLATRSVADFRETGVVLVDPWRG